MDSRTARLLCFREHTNVDLVTWQEFQNQFCQTWLENFLSPTITERMDRLIGFTEPFVQKWMCEIPDEDVAVVKALRAKYQSLGILAMTFTTYSTFLGRNGSLSSPSAAGLAERYSREIVVPDEILMRWGIENA